jgi:hypothetical protein
MKNIFRGRTWNIKTHIFDMKFQTADEICHNQFAYPIDICIHDFTINIGKSYFQNTNLNYFFAIHKNEKLYLPMRSKCF